jgi:hypothetical protein
VDDIKPGSFIYTNNPPVEIKGLMTLRDYFAAQAMQAMIQARATLPLEDDNSYLFATSCGINCETELVNGDKDPPEKFTWAGLLAIESYEMADAMLKARMENT